LNVPAPAGSSTRRAAEACFHSRAHPEGDSAALVYSRAMVPALGMTLIPLMLFALAGVLLGQRIWPYFFWAALPAPAVAYGWARFQLGRTVAEVRARPDQQAAAVRSVRDVLHEAPPAWQHAVRLRVERDALRLDLGDTSHRFHDDRWPDADALQDALRRAVRSS
jgi:hypothetical protein